MDDDDEGDDDYSAAVIDIGMDTVKVPSIYLIIFIMNVLKYKLNCNGFKCKHSQCIRQN